jgi:hypothetical protein
MGRVALPEAVRATVFRALARFSWVTWSFTILILINYLVVLIAFVESGEDLVLREVKNYFQPVDIAF